MEDWRSQADSGADDTFEEIWKNADEIKAHYKFGEDSFVNDETGSSSSPYPPGKRLAPVGANDDDASSTVSSDFRGDSSGFQAPENSPTVLPDQPKVDQPCHNHYFRSGSSSADAEEHSRELEEKVRILEKDQEDLNSSLMSMTSHFAKVQFRLQQVIAAPPEKRDLLLLELENFAFRGIPDVRPKIAEEALSRPQLESHKPSTRSAVPLTCSPVGDVLETQRKRHTELISQLKGQLEDLEAYVYESGEGNLPSKVLLERQRVVMEQLFARLNIDLAFDKPKPLTDEELKAEVDEAVGQLVVTPLKMKTHLIHQLKTQIEDLEMFIEYLQAEAININSSSSCSSAVPAASRSLSSTKKDLGCRCGSKTAQRIGSSSREEASRRRERHQEEIHKRTKSILEKTLAVLQLTAVSQFGCGSGMATAEGFRKNALKKTSKVNHYGDLRARLELAVDKVLEACSKVECQTDSDFLSTAGSEPIEAALSHGTSSCLSGCLMTSPEVASVVRKELAVAIKDLMHHGMVSTQGGGGGIRLGLPFSGCMNQGNAAAGNRSVGNQAAPRHAWEIILRFYEMKLGNEYNAAPARKLSQSFALDLTGSTGSNKYSFLATVGSIISTHTAYKRSLDAHFKAFVSAGLNKRKLIPWLRMVLRNQTILDSFYLPWAYVSKTGFEDSFKAIERLSIYAFDLPVDVAVRQFQQINDAF